MKTAFRTRPWLGALLAASAIAAAPATLAATNLTVRSTTAGGGLLVFSAISDGTKS
jgi:hypothetical protein